MSQSPERHGSTGIARILFAVLGLFLAGVLAWNTFGPGLAGSEAKVWIQDDGQVAGTPITIQGSGFGIGESVILTITHVGGAAEPGMGHEAWTVIAGDGTFTTTWSIHPADTQGDRFVVRAVGGLSGPANAVAFGRMAFTSTDLFDYQPGEDAGIEGGGFRPGETVTLHVIDASGGIHDPSTVTADAAGRIASTLQIDADDSLGSEFLLHAHGAESGLAGTWAFMDAVCAAPPLPDPVVPMSMLGVDCPTNLNSCTANDVTTTVVAAAPVNGDVCGSATDTVTLDFTVRFGTTANQRYDLGVFIASDGQSLPDHTAQECAGAAPQAGAGNGNADILDCDSDLFLDLDPDGHKVGNPDTCGDLQNSAGPVFITFRATVACDRFDDDRNLLVSSCRVWEQNANHDTACTNLAQAGAGSKCDCTDLSFADLLDPCVTAFCDDDNACTADSCDSTGGEPVCHNDPLADGSSCEDGDSCTEADACQSGECAGSPLSCDDGNVCTDDDCDTEAGCSNLDNTAPCGNGDFCDGEEVCSEGACTSPDDTCTAEQSCDEGNDRCVDCLDDSGCTAPGSPACEPLTGTCTECTANEDCQSPDAPFCDAGDNTCVECLTTAECDNGDFCDGEEVCTAGACTSPGNTCTAEESCDEAGDRCVDCLDDSGCTEPGSPACEPLTGTCTECTASEDCQNPDAPFCDTGDNTCVECLADAECDNGDACDGSESCVDHVCRAGLQLDCNDGNPCTADSCSAGGGCAHTDVGDAQDGSCESVTDSSLCPFPDDTFRLIELQNPTVGANGTVVQNDFKLSATNPGQAYYNVFYSGAPGAAFNLQIGIPWPYVTHGAHPIQVHDGTASGDITLGDGGCFTLPAALAGYTITTDGGGLSSSGNAVILRGDYPAQNLGATTAVHVSGVVPSSGLAYITIHLDYGLKKTTGWQQAPDLTTLQGPDNDLNGTLDGFGDGVVYIASGQDYTFSFSYGPTLNSTVSSVNSFKKNPGVNGLTLSSSRPKPDVAVKLLGPLGNLIASTTTDADGFYSFPYKHTGKAATYTVTLPAHALRQPVTLKANGYALLEFEDIYAAGAASTGGQKINPMEKTTP